MVRRDIVKEAIEEMCRVFAKYELTGEEIEHIAHCLNETLKLKQAEERAKAKVLKYLPAAISTLAIIISAISIAASI